MSTLILLLSVNTLYKISPVFSLFTWACFYHSECSIHIKKYICHCCLSWCATTLMRSTCLIVLRSSVSLLSFIMCPNNYWEKSIKISNWHCGFICCLPLVMSLFASCIAKYCYKAHTYVGSLSRFSCTDP